MEKQQKKRPAARESLVLSPMPDYDTSHEALMSCSQLKKKTGTADLRGCEPKVAHGSRTCSKRCMTREQQMGQSSSSSEEVMLGC